MTRADVGAVLLRAGVALAAFLVVQLVCHLAGWDASWYGVLTGFAAYLAYDNLAKRRATRPTDPKSPPRP